MKTRRMRRALRKVVIVTGTPGTGKTTFSRRLAKEIGANYIPLTEYVSRHRLYAGFDRERGSRIVNVSQTYASLRSLLSRSSGFSVIDTHIPEGIVPKEMVKLVIVLRCHPRTLEDRLRRKNWRPGKVRENVLAEILDSCFTSAVEFYGSRRIAQIDTSRANVRQSVAAAKRALRNRPTKKVRIDWITTLDREHSLDRYLE